MEKMIKRLGFHYYLDTNHYTQVDLDRWKESPLSASAEWVVLRGSLTRMIPEFFIRSLVSSGTRVVVHVPSPVQSMDPIDLRSMLTTYKRWGVSRVILFDRPNLRSQWPAADWNRSGLIERFMDLLIPTLQLQLEIGYPPVLPPLEPAGDYWDTAFLKGCLEQLKKLRLVEITSKVEMSCYAWSYGKPLNWGAGGPKRWTGVRPYYTPEGSQNQMGLCIVDWYDQIGKDTIDREIPVLVLQGGILNARSISASDQRVHRDDSLAIIRNLQGDALRASVTFFAFPLYASKHSAEAASASWYDQDGQPKPVIEALIKTDGLRKRQSNPSHTWSPESYFLLPTAADTAKGFPWPLIHAAAARESAVLGYSLEQARTARRVFLIGDEGEFPLEMERELVDHGRKVYRVPPAALAAAEKSLHLQQDQTDRTFHDRSRR